MESMDRYLTCIYIVSACFWCFKHQCSIIFNLLNLLTQWNTTTTILQGEATQLLTWSSDFPSGPLCDKSLPEKPAVHRTFCKSFRFTWLFGRFQTSQTTVFVWIGDLPTWSSTVPPKHHFSLWKSDEDPKFLNQNQTMNTLQVDFLDGYPRNPPVNSHGNGKLGLLKMYSLLLRGIFHCYVSLPECKVYRHSFSWIILTFFQRTQQTGRQPGRGADGGGLFQNAKRGRKGCWVFSDALLKGRRWKNNINKCVWTCMTASNLHTLGFRIMSVSWGIIHTAPILSHIDAVKSGMTLETYGT